MSQFAESRSGSTAPQMIVLGAMFTLIGLVFFATVGFFSGHIGTWLTERPGLTGKLRLVTGGVLVGLGIRLALTER